MTVPANPQQNSEMTVGRNLFTSRVSVNEAQMLLATQFPSLPGTISANDQGLVLSLRRADIDERTRDSLPKTAQAIAVQTHGVVTVVFEDTPQTQLDPQNAFSRSPRDTFLEASADQPLVARPMIRTVVLDRPFSDAYMDIPAAMLADLYSEHTLGSILHPNPTEFSAPLKEVREVLSKFLPPNDFKITRHNTFLQIILSGVADCVEDPAFFELSKQIVESNRHDYPILITIVPETPSADSVEQAPPETPTSAPEVIKAPAQSTAETIITLTTASPDSTLDRESLSDLAETARSLLRLKRECQWLDIQATPTGISLHSKTPLPDSVIDAIEKRLELLPAPVTLAMPAQAKDSLSITDIKSIVKLALPKTATLIRADTLAKEQFQKITVRIGVNPLQRTDLSQQLQVLQDAFKPVGQELAFRFESRPTELSARLELFHPRSLSSVFRKAKGGGAIIPIDSFKYEERQLKLSKSLPLLLHRYKHNHGARIFNDASVLAFDSANAGVMHEDAYSVKLDGNRVTLGIHVANGAFLINPTSIERFSAYSNGSSLYSPAGITASMLPGLRGLGLRTDKSCPAISMFVEVDAQSLTETRGRTKKTPLQFDTVRFELTEVSLKAAETYLDGEQGCVYQGTYQKEVAALQQFARLIREQELSVTLACRSLAVDIQTLLGFFNKKLAESLEGGFPLMYSSTSTVDAEAISTFIRDISAQAPKEHPIQELCRLSPTTLASDERLLSLLTAHFWSLTPKERYGIRLPIIEQSPTTNPDTLHLNSGYRGYTPANKALRNIAALVAQHQFNAQRGIYSPLCAEQVEILCERAQEQSDLAPRLRRDLLLFHDMEMLGTRTNMGIAARLVNSPHHPLRIDSLADQGRRLELLEGPSKLRDLASQSGGPRSITVWPSHYDVERDVLVFSLKKLQRP